MEKNKGLDHQNMVDNYDEEAEASNWLGPQVAFGLSFEYINPNETILDIGIGTGLTAALYHKAGLMVTGLDISEDMLNASGEKGITHRLVQHDLTHVPYPFEDDSMNHAVCTGVMNFFKDLTPVFQEASRILKKGGIFTFIVADKTEDESSEITVGREHTRSDATFTMHRHSPCLVDQWMNDFGFELKKSLEFPVPMDREQHKVFKARVYVARLCK